MQQKRHYTRGGGGKEAKEAPGSNPLLLTSSLDVAADWPQLKGGVVIPSVGSLGWALNWRPHQ